MRRGSFVILASQVHQPIPHITHSNGKASFVDWNMTSEIALEKVMQRAEDLLFGVLLEARLHQPLRQSLQALLRAAEGLEALFREVLRGGPGRGRERVGEEVRRRGDATGIAREKPPAAASEWVAPSLWTGC